MTRPYSIVRIRPAGLASVGLSKSRLHEVGRALAELPSEDRTGVSPRTVTFTSQSIGPQFVAEASEVLVQACHQSSNVVIDLDYPSDETRDGAVDEALHAVLLHVLDHCRADHRLLILVQDLPGSTDSLIVAPARHPRGGAVAIIQTHDALQVDVGWVPSEALLAAAVQSDGDLVQDLARRTLRRRGVFVSMDKPDEHLAHYFSLKLALPALSTLLMRYIKQSSPDVLLYASRDGGWLSEVLLSLTLEPDETASIPLHGLLEMLDPTEAGARDDALARSGAAVMARLARPTCEVLVVMPFIKSGESAIAALRELRSVYQGSLQVLAIMVDERRLDHLKRSSPLVVDGDEIPVDHLIPERQEVLARDDWRVLTAVATDEVEAPHKDWIAPSRIGLWSLLAELGFAEEYVVPGPQGTAPRLPIRHFPKLDDLSDADALWIAECLVLRAERELGTRRENLAMLLPDDPTGAGPIGLALKHRLDVPVELLRREVIDGTEEVDEATIASLKALSSQRIVVADESTVTYGTLTRMGDLVREWTGRNPSLYIVAVELPLAGSNRLDRLHSLYSWRPVLFAERGGHDAEAS